MNIKEFQEMPLLERVEFINRKLLEHDKDPLKKVAGTMNMSYSAFCKEMKRGGFTYSQSKRQYEKSMSVAEYKKIQLTPSDDQRHDDTIQFINTHIDEIKELLSSNSNNLVLNPVVYDVNSKSITKSLVVNKEIYETFTDVCTKQFPHLRLKDIVSQCLYDFIKKHKKTPS